MEEAPRKRGRPSKAEIQAREDADRSKRVVCMNCGCLDQNKFYKSHNPFNKYYEKIPYCKDCIRGEMWAYFLKKYKNNEQLALHALLRALNLPYIHSVYLASIKNINNPNALIKNSVDAEEETDSALVSAYMKNYNSFYTQNNYGNSYIDSQGIDQIVALADNEPHLTLKRRKPIVDDNVRDEDKYEYIDYDADELIDKWGEFDDLTLKKLELEYLDWKDKIGDCIKEKSTDIMVKQVCFLTIAINDKRVRGETVEDEMKELRAILKDSGLLEKQQSQDIESTKIGMTIGDIEQFRPLKETLPELVDVDHYGEIIDTFIGAMSRTMGKTNEFTERFDKLYKDYTIDIVENAGEFSNGRDETDNNS